MHPLWRKWLAHSAEMQMTASLEGCQHFLWDIAVTMRCCDTMHWRTASGGREQHWSTRFPELLGAHFFMPLYKKNNFSNILLEGWHACSSREITSRYFLVHSQKKCYNDAEPPRPVRFFGRYIDKNN